MKKLFIILSGCFTFLIVALLIFTNFIFINQKITLKQPDSINIYKKSIAALNNKLYDSNDREFNDIIKNVSNVGNVSIFDRLITNSSLNDKINQSKDNEYSNNIADLKNTGYCIEFIYELKQDKIVYIDGKSKVITFNKLLYVFPSGKGMQNILVYYSEGSNSYENYNPLVFDGKTEKIINYINSL